MAEAPPGQKRKRDEPPGARKRRRVRSSVERASAETARSLGGVAAFKDVWGALVKASWTSKRPSSKCLDSRYKYIRPGGRHDGEEGADYLLGELAVLRYIEDMRVVAAEQAAQVSGKTEGAADFDGLPVLVA
ncbi:hypothetical protein PI125_g10020 [Phytophthora idaei]|nr:hypothetical protein PI125_g10020 [Phytophthora idaei]KAG3113743.1 hypothetical protein PI126_g24750 [Phytophthora idaei]